jgi:L-lactate dehydrogenase
MDFMVESAHRSRPRVAGQPVRLPGEAGLRRYRDQQAHGVALYPTIMPALEPWAAKLGVAVPVAC